MPTLQQSPAFRLSSLPLRRARPQTPSCSPRLCTSPPQPARRIFLQRALALTAGCAVSLNGNQPTAAANNPAKLERSVVPVVMCRKVMNPVRRYISEGAWDKGRTNVNYCTRVLALRSRMRDAAEMLEGDAYYDAMDIMGEMSTVMTQLDASLYTPLFIPADEGVSLEQRKYQKEAFGYYDEALSYLDTFLSKVPEDVLGKAQTTASKAKYEIKVEEQ